MRSDESTCPRREHRPTVEPQRGLDTAGSGSLKTEERTQGPNSSQAMGAEAATTHHLRGRTRQCTN